MENGNRQYHPFITYYADHHARFLYTIETIKNHLPISSKIADIGCHRLDLTAMLKKEGYDIYGFDVPEFIKKPSVIKTATDHNIPLYAIHDLHKGTFEKEFDSNYFDAILFCEVIEHLSFNPIIMWKELVRILKPGGMIFLSTPNGTSLKNLYNDLKSIIFRRGTGVDVKDILNGPSYSHHWKEYSRNELFTYFFYLGFAKSNIIIDYVRFTDRRHNRSLRSLLILMIETICPSMKPYLFATVHIDLFKPSLPDPPAYLG